MSKSASKSASKSTNTFAALAYESDSDSESSVVHKDVVHNVDAKAIATPNTIPTFPSGGINLLEMFPDMAQMELCMRRGVSWYDMFYYEEDLAKFRAERERERKYGPAEVIQEDEWTCITKHVESSHVKQNKCRDHRKGKFHKRR
jgi:hypothetical protein